MSSRYPCGHLEQGPEICEICVLSADLADARVDREVYRDKSAVLQAEVSALKETLSGRTVSCGNCNAAARKAREFDKSLIGTEIPADELKVSLDFEDFNSKEAMMFGWSKGNRALYIIARAYKASEAQSAIEHQAAVREKIESQAREAAARQAMHLLERVNVAARRLVDSIDEDEEGEGSYDISWLESLREALNACADSRPTVAPPATEGQDKP